jgi:hypothetical protein
MPGLFHPLRTLNPVQKMLDRGNVSEKGGLQSTPTSAAGAAISHGSVSSASRVGGPIMVEDNPMVALEAFHHNEFGNDVSIRMEWTSCGRIEWNTFDTFEDFIVFTTLVEHPTLRQDLILYGRQAVFSPDTVHFLPEQ